MTGDREVSDMTDEYREEEKDQETEKLGNGDEQRSETRNPEPTDSDDMADGIKTPGPMVNGSTAGISNDTTPHPYEELLEDYPLREASEDPVWSVRIVKWWLWILAVAVTGVVLLLVLGFFYD
jgi:hypothetical protein